MNRTYMPASHSCLHLKAAATALLVPLFLLLSLLSGHGALGQNLVANFSFEDVNNCSEYNQPCSPSAWFFEERKVTSGYFPRYHSATGVRHLQIVAATRETPNRQYWETMLLSPLVAGEKYRVTVKLASTNGGPNLRDIGFWFTNGFIFSRNDSLLQPPTYVRFTDATTKDLKNGWFEVKKEFVAAKGASFLIIGNFSRQSNEEIMDQRNRPDGSIDILVDDLVLVPAKEIPCTGCKNIKDSLYAILNRHHNPPNDVWYDREPPPGSTNDPRSDSTANPPTAGQQQPDRPVTQRQPEPAAPIPARKTDTLRINNIQFDFDQYRVSNADTLERYRTYLTQPDIKSFKVVGFTDDRGSEGYNKDLSEKRAHAVALLLTEKFGIPNALIEAEGKGISRDYKDKYMNRRVEIYIFH